MAVEPFDFTRAMYHLCDDIVRRTPELSHVRMREVAVTFAQARRRVLHGLQAKLTPLRFEHGALITQRGRTRWTVRRIFQGNVEILYILTFYLPRFLDQTFDEKLITIFHELFHVSPRFDGDIRRMEGRYHVHSHSQKEYDRAMLVLARRYLDGQADERLWGFLHRNFDELKQRHGAVIGHRLPIPKLLRLDERRSA